MTTHLRHLAPSGTPTSAVDILRWMWRLAVSRPAGERVQATIRERFGVRHVFLVSTGRAAMTVLFRALRRLADPSLDVIVVPSYTCYSVAASAVKAGLRVQVVDVAAETLDYDPAALAAVDFSRVLAVVATNLYGNPSNLQAIRDVTHGHQTFVIDDAAQAMGARTADGWCGARGDAGLFSFDKGKNVSAIDGGVLLTSSDVIAEAVEEEMRGLAPVNLTHGLLASIKVLAYSLFLRPWLYWIPNGIPQLGLGKTAWDVEFPLSEPDPVLTSLASVMLSHLDERTAERRERAGRLIAGLRSLPGLSVVAAGVDRCSACLRVPVLFADASQRDLACAALNAAGVGATGSYPTALSEVPDLQPHLVAPARDACGREVARRILTLPTHAYVTSRDIERMLAVLKHRLLEPREPATVVDSVVRSL